MNHVTWGTSPDQVIGVHERIPSPEDFEDPSKQLACAYALEYMGLQPRTLISDVPIDFVFIGSCKPISLQVDLGSVTVHHIAESIPRLPSIVALRPIV